MYIPILVPMVVGELLDKMSILYIKSVKMTGSSERLLCLKEWQNLHDEYLPAEYVAPDYWDLYTELVVVNTELWEVEDGIRELLALEDRSLAMMDEIIQFSEQIVRLNAQRTKLKNQATTESGGAIELKDY